MVNDFAILQHSRLLYDSYQRMTGEQLLPGKFENDEKLSNALYRAPFVVLSHGVQDDPVFNYANESAQVLWEMTWDEFLKLPSRFSAEPVAMEERKIMLEDARERGVTRNYSGVRISRSGKRFIIKNATLWNVEDDDGTYCGQAVKFDEWEFIAKK